MKNQTMKNCWNLKAIRIVHASHQCQVLNQLHVEISHFQPVSIRNNQWVVSFYLYNHSLSLSSLLKFFKLTKRLFSIAYNWIPNEAPWRSIPLLIDKNVLGAGVTPRFYFITDKPKGELWIQLTYGYLVHIPNKQPVWV